MKQDALILVRGGGDLATGTIHRLWSAGLKVLVLEAEHPAAIRRQVSVSEAVYEGGAVVEGMRAALVKTLDEDDSRYHKCGHHHAHIQHGADGGQHKAERAVLRDTAQQVCDERH